MHVLGAIIAGGQSRRFGRDKAAEPINGVAIIDQIAAALTPQVAAVILCGRQWRGLESVADRPAAGLGPLGGLAAALHYAGENGFEAVLSVPVDVIPLPVDLAVLLGGDGATVLSKQHLIGWWPAAFGPLLDQHLAEPNDRSLRQWFERCQPRRVADPPGLVNVNRVTDLALLQLPRTQNTG